MELDDLVAEFSRLPGALVGEGPCHPDRPNRDLAPLVDRFLADYPRLRDEGDYVEFLQKYSGATVENEQDGQFVDIFGFSEVSSNIVELEGDVVDRDGYLVFAQCMYQDIRDGKLTDSCEYDFAFNVEGSKEPGVYCCRSTLRGHGQSFEIYSGGFSEWLHRLVGIEAWLERPPFGRG